MAYSINSQKLLLISCCILCYNELVMHLEVLIILGVAGAAGAGYWYLSKTKNKHEDASKLSQKDREFLSKEIEQGIIYEDNFVDTYYNLLRNQGYMHTFGGHEKQAHDLLYKMVEESKAHKTSLLNIKKQLGL